ncbi:MAG: helix-turn-helix transcriptional regulator [Planctomycetes bacterium]|nr:helix-turn-helix transcriptional regulator [Planctomycetota bacterium]
MDKGEHFGDLFSSLVRRRGLTMAAFAALVEASPSSLSRIRTGKQAPEPAHAERWAATLGLEGPERREFLASALLAATPAPIRARLHEAETQTAAARDQGARLAEDFGRYRSMTGFHDGSWLTYSRSFLNDGLVQRSLLKIDGDRAALEVRTAGMLRYSYHGSCEALGDKLFLRLAEDRGGVEWVQITLHSLFDWSRPAFLYGLVCGISGKDVQHGLSWPAAARMVLLHVPQPLGEPAINERRRQLTDILGAFPANQLRHLWPGFLGEDDHLRAALRLDDGDLDATLLRLTDNGLGNDHVLRAVLGA